MSDGKKELGVIINKPKRQYGFSLIEVLVALTVVAVGILGFIKMQTFLERKSEYSQMGMAALQIAESEMQYAQNIPFTLLGNAGGSITRASGVYYWTRTSTAAMSGDAKRITLSIAWQDKWSQSHSLSLSTLRSKFN